MVARRERASIWGFSLFSFSHLFFSSIILAGMGPLRSPNLSRFLIIAPPPHSQSRGGRAGVVVGRWKWNGIDRRWREEETIGGKKICFGEAAKIMAGRKNLATRMAGREEIIILAGRRFGEDGGKVFWRILSSGGKGMGERKVLRVHNNNIMS